MPNLVNVDAENSGSTAIGFLVINQIQELPRVAILSALSQTKSDIYVGFIDPAVLSELPIDSRVHYLQLNLDKSTSPLATSEYQDFGTEIFYILVQLKWQLFKAIHEIGYNFVIYSDIDVVWLGDAAADIKKTFEVFSDTHILVQSFTRHPSNALLCMGFFSFRSSPIAIDFINRCELKHYAAISSGQKIGDDEIVTAVNRELGFPSYVRELPQSTFAVGNFLDLYASKPSFPGVHKPVPLFFHLNYVVGLRNKRLMLRILLTRKQRKNLGIRFGLNFYLLYTLKKIKHSSFANLISK